MLKRTRQLEHAFGEPCGRGVWIRRKEHTFGEPYDVWMCRKGHANWSMPLVHPVVMECGCIVVSVPHAAVISHDQLSPKLACCAVISLADQAMDSCKLVISILLHQDTWLWVRSHCHHTSNSKETTPEQRMRNQDGISR